MTQSRPAPALAGHKAPSQVHTRILLQTRERKTKQSLAKCDTLRTSLEVLWLGPCASTAGPWVRSLVRDLRSQSPTGGLITKSCSTLVTLWTVACQVPLSMGFSRPGYWRGFPFPSPGDLPDPGIKPGSLELQADSLPTKPPGKSLSEAPRCVQKKV